MPAVLDKLSGNILPVPASAGTSSVTAFSNHYEHHASARRPRLLLASAAVILFATPGLLLAQNENVTTPKIPPPAAPAQSPTPNAAPQATGASATDLPSAPSAPIFTLKTGTRRVVVDIVVTDAKGRPVTGLSAKDFSVLEDNKPQPVRSFDVHTVATESPYVPPKLPKLSANTFVNVATAPESGTPTVILYDILNTSLQAQMYAHQEIVSFIKHRKPGTQFAIFALSDRLHLLQGFTDDPDTLTKALDSKSGKPGLSTLLSVAGATATSAGDVQNLPSAATSAGSVPVGQPGVVGDTTNRTNPGLDASQVTDSIGHSEAIERSQFLDRRIEITLEALTEIGRFLASLPGRKNLVWLSGSFPSGILPDATINVNALDSDQSARNYTEEIRQATDLLNASHVAVYPVDARGLSSDAGLDASSSTGYGSNPSNYSKAVTTSVLQDAADRGTMDSIAEMTGGKAFYHTNDLQTAVDSAINHGSTYYSLSYAPTNPNFDGRLRKIKVKLQQAGYNLSYRTEYYADDLAAAEQAVQDAPQNPLTPSLEHGTPVSHELFVSAHLDAVGEPVPATPKQMELLSQYEAMRTKKKSKTPPAQLPPVLMQQYVIQYGLIPRQLELQPIPTGAHEASLELGVISYDQDGRKLNGIDTRITDDIPTPRYALLRDEGYHVFQQVEIPVTASSIRLAVRDTKANRIGSLEVQLPLAKPDPPKQPELKTLGEKADSSQ